MDNNRDELLLLESTKDAIERNHLALKLSAERPGDVADVLARMIVRPDLKNARGTLVHCLAQIDPAAHFPLFVELLISGGWEAAHESLDALSLIKELHSPDIPVAVNLLQSALKSNIEEWRRPLIENVLGAIF